MNSLEEAAGILAKTIEEIEDQYQVPFKDRLIEILETDRKSLLAIDEYSTGLLRRAENVMLAADALRLALDEDESDPEPKLLLQNYYQRIDNGEFDGLSFNLLTVFLSNEPETADKKNGAK